MSNNQQPEALRLAHLLALDKWPNAAAELRRLHAENQSLQSEAANNARIIGASAEKELALRAQVEELERKLVAVGAGGVEPLRKRAAQSAVPHTSTALPVAYLWQHTITGQTKALMRDDVFTAGPHWRLVGPLFLATESGQAADVPEAIEQMAADRYKVVPSHESVFHRWAVVADNGAQQLYIGREGECQNMARKFMGAFLDGAFVAMQNAAAPQGLDAQVQDRLDRLYLALEVCSAELFAQCADQGRAMKYVDQARSALAAEQCARAAQAKQQGKE